MLFVFFFSVDLILRNGGNFKVQFVSKKLKLTYAHYNFCIKTLLSKLVISFIIKKWHLNWWVLLQKSWEVVLVLKNCFLVWLLWIMVFDFESVTEQSKMSSFHKYSCSVKHIRHKNLLVNSVYTKKAHECIKQ